MHPRTPGPGDRGGRTEGSGRAPGHDVWLGRHSRPFCHWRVCNSLALALAGSRQRTAMAWTRYHISRIVTYVRRNVRLARIATLIGLAAALGAVAFAPPPASAAVTGKPVGVTLEQVATHDGVRYFAPMV